MNFLKWLMVTLVAMVLAACGGGGTSLYTGSSTTGSGSTTTTSTTTTSTTPTVTLALSSKVLAVGSPVTATATVVVGSTPVSGAAVNFTQLLGTVASLSSGSSRTDDSGSATVTLTALSSTAVGSDTLTAATTVSGNAITASTLFSVNSAASIEMLASSNLAASSGDDVTVTAIVKSAGGVGIKGAPVVFSTDTGTLKSPSDVTDATGVATVKFTAGSNKANRTATIKVASGAASNTLTLPIDGSKLSVSGATTVTQSGTTTLSVKATDSANNGIAFADLTVTSSLSNGLSSATVKTDAQGQATVTYMATNAGSDTLTFKGLGATNAATIAISNVDFVFVDPAPSTLVPVSTARTLQVRYRQGGVGVAGQTINFATTAGKFNGGPLNAATATTDASGIATVTVLSDSAAPASVRASLAGGSAQATLPLSFIATTPSRLVLQVSPTAIGPNAAGATTNQAQVLARLTDPSGNPVTGATINFSRDVDPSGGNLLQGSAETDLNGQATVQYVAGSQSTATNGVLLRGRVDSATGVTAAAGLTVSQSALFIALGTGNTITNSNPQVYQKDWTAYVTDANGVAVPNVIITAKVIPKEYMKGILVWTPAASSWAPVFSATCINEDDIFTDTDARSFNGILDVGEDVNNNGKLEPGNVVSLTNTGPLKTDANGRVTLSLQYAESYVPWVRVRLQVQAIVAGTASTTESVFIVSGDSKDLTDQTVTPAGATSPFGTANACANPL